MKTNVVEIIPPKLVLIAQTEDGQDAMQFLTNVYKSVLDCNKSAPTPKQSSQRSVIIKKIKLNQVPDSHRKQNNITTVNLLEQQTNLHTEDDRTSLRRTMSGGFKPPSFTTTSPKNLWRNSMLTSANNNRTHVQTTSKIPIIKMQEMGIADSPQKDVRRPMINSFFQIDKTRSLKSNESPAAKGTG